MARAFVLGKPLQSSLKFVSKGRAYLSGVRPSRVVSWPYYMFRKRHLMVLKCMSLFFYLTLEFETKLKCLLWTGSMPANGVASFTNEEAQ
jgi:hypothetical protein